ncbi:MAG: prolyl aminopeptidase, partial [Rhodovibrionaceae bacterium]
MLDKDLYPAIEPHASGYLRVAPQHEIYWEEVGRRDGLPVVFLHGGPGAGASADHRRFFDPAQFRALLFDQRGAGRSRPHGETVGNT